MSPAADTWAWVAEKGGLREQTLHPTKARVTGCGGRIRVRLTKVRVMGCRVWGGGQTLHPARRGYTAWVEGS